MNLREDKLELAIVVGCFVLIFGVIAGSIMGNHKANQSVVGKPAAALVEEFGVPTAKAPAGPDTEVMEWTRYVPGYFSTNWISDGRRGGYMSTTYIPPRDSVRKAVIRHGICVDCSGGY